MSDETRAIASVENNPLAIIANAVEKGFDADQLGKLVDMHERIEAMNAKRAYQESMTACQQELQTIVKTAANTHTKSSYAELGNLIHQIKPIYTRHGFSFSFSQMGIAPPKDGWMRIVCDVMHNRGHREQKWLDLPIDGAGAKGGATAMNAVQGVGSTFTYGQRYLTMKIFNLSLSNEDLDGNLPEPALNDEQRRMIEKLLLESEQDMVTFLKWAQVEKVADMPQRLYVNARDHLNAKIKAKQAEKK